MTLISSPEHAVSFRFDRFHSVQFRNLTKPRGFSCPTKSDFKNCNSLKSKLFVCLLPHGRNPFKDGLEDTSYLLIEGWRRHNVELHVVDFFQLEDDVSRVLAFKDGCSHQLTLLFVLFQFSSSSFFSGLICRVHELSTLGGGCCTFPHGYYSWIVRT